MKKIFIETLKNTYYQLFKKKNFSQGKEEVFLKKYFIKNQTGFYIDVGCHDPFRFSSTAFLYKKGWSGLNIDPNEKSIKRFNIHRKRDINIRGLVSDSKKTLKYYYFDDHALNGVLDKKRIELLIQNNYKIIKFEKIETISLNEILNKNKILKKIDFLNIDVEGTELNVLKSIDLNKYLVKLIIVEENDNLNKIENYLSKYRYMLIDKVDRNLVFEKV